MSDVTMPQLGETVTEGTITRWFKKVGDPVARDEVLFEVSTDKVDSEVASPAAGVLLEIRIQEGTTADVGTVLAVIGEAGAAPAPAVAAPAPAAPVVAAPVAPVAEAAPAPAPVPPPTPVAAAVPAPPAATPAAPPAPVPVAGEPSGSSIVTPAPAAASSTGSTGSTDRVLSPVVRRLINEHGLDPNTIAGTGVGGRITREDVLDLIETSSMPGGGPVSGVPAQPAAPVATAQDGAVTPAAAVAAPPAAPPAPAPAVAPAPMVAETGATAPVAAEAAVAAAVVAPLAAPAVAAPVPAAPAPAPPIVPAVAASTAPALRPGGRDEIVPFTNIRRRTGEHMVMSLSTSPHAFIAVEVDFHRVDQVRSAQKERFKVDEGFSLTYLPFITRATVEAIRKFPNVNASVSGDSLVVHHSVHVGVAVDLDFSGLLVPVIRDADEKRMRAIARDISDLAGRARTKKLTMDDLSGGTITLSNAGPYGIDLMQSIINQPQVAILSITGVKKRPVVVETADGDEAIVVRPIGTIGLSWDHRAFDGAYAASFLSEIRNALQTRDWASEL